jgi:hypothetical protein
MSAEMGFTTLREAFLVANSIEDINKMASKDGVINDSVKRILIPRISEFLLWKEMSEKEIRKRFEIEKSYLKSEVESLKLYTRWASPYLKAAKDLQMKGFEKSAALVSAFSTTMFELTLFGQREKSISRDEILKKRFYEDRVNPLKTDRQYFEVFVITLKYRGHLGQKAGQGSQSGYAFAFGGRVDITFDCYALNSEEIELTKKYVANSEVGELLSLVSDNTQTALDQLKDDIEKYTSDKEEEKKEEEKKSNDNTNPFEALFELFKGNLSFGKENKKGQKIEKPEEIKKDSFVEEAVREKAGESAKKFLFTIYDVYKKAHRMASSPDNFDN